MGPLSQRSKQSGPSTPPSSPGKRRQMLRESEETSGEMTLETYLYNSDAFRCSSFRPPWPLPLMLEAPEPDFLKNGEKMRPLEPKIRSILKNHSMEENTFHFGVSWVSKRGYPEGGTRSLTLIIYMDQAFPSKSSWAHARDDLRTMFSAEGLGSIHVEIFDRKRAFMPWLLPLKPDDRAVRTYEALRKYLLQVVEESLSNHWVAMSLFGLGSRSGSVKSALVILVQPETIRDWTDISSRLRTIWPDSDISIEFLPALEFLPGIITQSKGISLDSKLTRHPHMGSSIGGEHEEFGAGTLGGHVILKRNGIKHYGVLTNHHVVRPLSATKETIDELDQHGYGLSHSHFTTLMQYPAIKDHKASQERIEASIINYANEFKATEAKLKAFEITGQEPPETLLDYLNMAEDALKEAKERKELVNQLPIMLGKALYSSGQAISSKNTILDWAFVELNDVQTFPERPNKLPNANVAGLDGKLSDFFELQGVSYNVSNAHPDHARYFSTIEKGKWYFKIGRSSGITAGVCHGTEMEVARKGQIRWSERGEQITLGTNSTSELVIIGKSRLSYEPDVEIAVPETFALDGDAGSFVFDKYGEVAGLLYGSFAFPGSDNRLQTNAGLVTSMDEVLESIKAKTWGELCLP